MLHTASHQLWLTWVGMHQRCYRKDSPGFKNYGGRGITVCERWHSFSSFVEDVGCRPDGFQLDRIDCSGPYTKENCRWVSRSGNSRNKRNTVRVEYEGAQHSLADLADRFGIGRETAYRRYRKGWPLDKVLHPSTTAFKSRAQDLIGMIFGRLTVSAFSHTDKDSCWWVCQCSCGGSRVVKSRHLRSGNTRSCGCLLSEYHSRGIETA